MDDRVQKARCQTVWRTRNIWIKAKKSVYICNFSHVQAMSLEEHLRNWPCLWGGNPVAATGREGDSSVFPFVPSEFCIICKHHLLKNI